MVDELAACRAARVRRARRRMAPPGLATPLLLTATDAAFARRLPDRVRSDPRATTPTVHGEDPLAGLAVADADVRRACEAQARSHAAAPAGVLPRDARHSRRRSRCIIAASAAPFRALLAAVGRLHGERGPLDDGAARARGRDAPALDAGVVRQVLAAARARRRRPPTPKRSSPPISQPPSTWCDMSTPGAPDRRAMTRACAPARDDRGGRCVIAAVVCVPPPARRRRAGAARR